MMSRFVYKRLATSNRHTSHTFIAHTQHILLCHQSISTRALEQHMHKPNGIPQAAYMLAKHAYLTGGYGPRISAD